MRTADLRPLTSKERAAKKAAAQRGSLRFFKARNAEQAYARQLRSVATQIGNIVKMFAPEGEVEQPEELQSTLRRYADLIGPWAKAAASRMVAEVSRRDAKAWAEHSSAMGVALRKELASAPTGAILRKLMDEQVTLITSLPLDAAKRVHELTMKSISQTAARPKEIAEEILRTGEVTKSRATLIARTEVARTASNLTIARATHVGCTHYIWRTAKDSDVRPSHKEMDGKVIAFDEAPILSDGTQTHAGCIYNCRCWVSPILPDTIE